MINLKPCPFCGGQAVFNYSIDLLPDGIRCSDCKYIMRFWGMPKATQTTRMIEIMEPMAERWNKRECNST